MAAAGGTAEDKDLLAVLRLFAERAGKAILANYLESTSYLELERKPDGTPITYADEASEEILLAALETLTPGVPVYSEEQVYRQGAPQQVPGRFWLVDPLDGTEQYLAQNAEFTVNLALIEEGRPIAGVVHAPALAMTWAGAGPGSAAFSQTDHPPMAIAVRRPPDEGLVLFTHRYSDDGESLRQARARHRIAKHHRSGGGLPYGFLASGKADLYAFAASSHEWRSAAGQALLQAAGGRVLATDGTPLAYGKPKLVTRGFLAYGATEA